MALALCLLGTTTFASQVTEICYNGNPALIPGGSGPNPTAICRFGWSPGGIATIGRHKITLASPEPGIIGGTTQAWYDIAYPAYGEKYGYMDLQCVHPSGVATLQGWAYAYRQAIRDSGTLILMQTEEDITGGTYPFYCPGG